MSTGPAVFAVEPVVGSLLVTVTDHSYGVFHCMSAMGGVQYGVVRVPEVIAVVLMHVWPVSGSQVSEKL